MMSSRILFVFTTAISLVYSFKQLSNGAVESKVLNPGPIPKIDPLEQGDGDEVKISTKDRNAVGSASRWINGTVPYELDPTLLSADKVKSAVDQAIADYHNFTCIKFRLKTPQDLDWILISNGEGCSSKVGRRGVGQQKVTLGPGCGYKGTVIHELMHAIGFGHEQCRPDRDEYVIVDLGQVPQDKKHNFDKYDGTDGRSMGETFGFKYDYGSIMHYSANAFSSTTQPSMRRKDGQPLVVQRSGFGDYDVKKINIYYGCDTGNPPAPEEEFATPPPLPPPKLKCLKVVIDSSCDNIKRICSGNNKSNWNQKQGECTLTCSCK